MGHDDDDAAAAAGTLSCATDARTVPDYGNVRQIGCIFITASADTLSISGRDSAY